MMTDADDGGSFVDDGAWKTLYFLPGVESAKHGKKHKMTESSKTNNDVRVQFESFSRPLRRLQFSAALISTDGHRDSLATKSVTKDSDSKKAQVLFKASEIISKNGFRTILKKTIPFENN